MHVLLDPAVVHRVLLLVVQLGSCPRGWIHRAPFGSGAPLSGCSPLLPTHLSTPHLRSTNANFPCRCRFTNFRPPAPAPRHLRHRPPPPAALVALGLLRYRMSHLPSIPAPVPELPSPPPARALRLQHVATVWISLCISPAQGNGTSPSIGSAREPCWLLDAHL